MFTGPKRRYPNHSSLFVPTSPGACLHTRASGALFPWARGTAVLSSQLALPGAANSARAWWADAVCDLGTGFSSIFRVEQGLDSSLPPLTRWARHPFAGHCLRNLPRGPAKDTGFIFQIWHLGDWYFAWAIRLWLVLSLLSYLNPGFEVWGSMLDRFACNMVIYFIEDRVFFSEF